MIRLQILDLSLIGIGALRRQRRRSVLAGDNEMVEMIDVILNERAKVRRDER